MNVPLISKSVEIYTEIKRRLLEADPDIDDETLNDTAEGETDLQERLVRLCRASKEAEAMAGALGGMIEDMRARKKRLESRAERLRGLALWAMQEAGMPKLVAPDLSATISKGRTSVQITDVGAIPPMYIEYEPKPERLSIRAALLSGEDVPGAVLTNSPPSLTLRTK